MLWTLKDHDSCQIDAFSAELLVHWAINCLEGCECDQICCSIPCRIIQGTKVGCYLWNGDIDDSRIQCYQKGSKEQTGFYNSQTPTREIIIMCLSVFERMDAIEQFLSPVSESDSRHEKNEPFIYNKPIGKNRTGGWPVLEAWSWILVQKTGSV